MTAPPLGRASSVRADRFGESVIREMSRVLIEQRPDGINLAQGFPDFPAPDQIKAAACAAINDDVNQYAVTFGNRDLRRGVAEKMRRFYSMDVNPDSEVTVCCGATESLVATLLGILDPGDEVVIFEPFYENYGPDCIIAGAVPRYVDLHAPEFRLDPAELRAAFSARTRAIIINTPHNPTGKVFSREELTLIAELCQEFDALAITDEIYEHIVYSGEHIPMATLPGMAQRTVTISGMSKSYSVTGWRVGWAIAPPQVTLAIRKMHDFLTVGAAAPLQAAGVAAVALPDSFYEAQLEEYRERRAHLTETLRRLGLRFTTPDGAYYTMADIGGLGFASDVEFAAWLVREVGVAVVPGSSFYAQAADGAHLVRFAFPKRMATLERARELLLAARGLRPADPSI
jgi:aspartate/methionine/tyrosine aminotransferase